MVGENADRMHVALLYVLSVSVEVGGVRAVYVGYK